MASVMLPEKALLDPGRGQAWLLTTVAHFGGQDAIDDVDAAVRLAKVKDVPWKKTLAATFPFLAELLGGADDPLGTIGQLVDAITNIPVPVQAAE